MLAPLAGLVGPAWGLVVVGMARHGFSATTGAGRWIAIFYGGHAGHQPITAAGTAQAVPTAGRHGAAVGQGGVKLARLTCELVPLDTYLGKRQCFAGLLVLGTM